MAEDLVPISDTHTGRTHTDPRSIFGGKDSQSGKMWNAFLLVEAGLTEVFEEIRILSSWEQLCPKGEITDMSAIASNNQHG